MVAIDPKVLHEVGIAVQLKGASASFVMVSFSMNFTELDPD